MRRATGIPYNIVHSMHRADRGRRIASQKHPERSLPLRYNFLPLP